MMIRWRCLLVGVVFCRVWLLAFMSAPLANNHAQVHVTTPHLNWWQWDAHAPPMGWFLVDFALFVVGLAYFAAGPLRQAFAQRHLTIRRAITEAAQAHVDAQAKQALWQNKLAGIEQEVQIMLEKSRADGLLEQQHRVKAAQNIALQLEKDAEVLVEQQWHYAQSRLQRGLLVAALDRVRQQLAADLPESLKQSLLEAAVRQLTDAKPSATTKVHG